MGLILLLSVVHWCDVRRGIVASRGGFLRFARTGVVVCGVVGDADLHAMQRVVIALMLTTLIGIYFAVRFSPGETAGRSDPLRLASLCW